MTSMPRRAISPSNAPSIRTPPEPLMEPCQITPEPSTDVMRSTAWTGCCGSVGVGLRLNMEIILPLKDAGADTARKCGPPLRVSCYLLLSTFLFLGSQLNAHCVEA